MKPILRRISSLLSVIFLVSFCVTSASANEYYWVGGTGNWSDFSRHWATTSGGSAFYLQVPQSVDNVHFDAGSGFTGTSKTVTIDVLTASTNDVDWTGALNTPIFTLTSGNSLNVSGSFTLISAMTISFSGTLNFTATSTGKNINVPALPVKSFGVTNFTGVGGGWTLQTPFVSFSTLQLTGGTLNTNNQPVTAQIFSSTGSNTRSLILGDTLFTITLSNSAATAWSVTGTNLTVIPAKSKIVLNSTALGIPSFSGGIGNYYDVSWTGVAGTSGGTLIGGTSYHNVLFSSLGAVATVGPISKLTFLKNGAVSGSNVFDTLSLSPGYNYSFASANTQTIKEINATGNCSNGIVIQSSIVSVPAIFKQVAGNVNFSFAYIKDISGTGGALYAANNSVDGGNNSSISFSPLAGRTLYWVGNSGNWNDGNHWSTISGGAASNCVPGPADDAVFDGASFTIGSQIVTINTNAIVNNMDWSAATNIPTLTCLTPSALSISGSITLTGAMNLVNYTGALNFIGKTTGQSISTFGKTIGSVNFIGAGGGWTLQNELKVNGTITLNNGSWNTNSQPVTAVAFNSVLTATRSLTLVATQFTLTSTAGVNSSVTCWNLTSTGLTFNAGTSNLIFTNNGAGSANMIPGNLTYYDLTWTGASAAFGQIAGSTIGNAYHDVKFASAGLLSTTASTYNSVTFSKSGTIGGVNTGPGNTIQTLVLSPGYTYQFLANTIQTVGTLTAPGTCNALIELQSTLAGTFAIISRTAGSTNLVLDYLSLKDIQRAEHQPLQLITRLMPDIIVVLRSVHRLHVRFTGSATGVTGMIPSIGRLRVVVKQQLAYPMCRTVCFLMPTLLHYPIKQ